MHDQPGYPPPIDLDHLDQQTFGDSVLARELLGLFEQQCERLWPALTGVTAEPSRSDAAHTLKGGARAVGAFPIASLADRIEAAADADHSSDTVAPLIQALGDAIAAYRTALLRLYPPPL